MLGEHVGIELGVRWMPFSECLKIVSTRGTGCECVRNTLPTQSWHSQIAGCELRMNSHAIPLNTGSSVSCSDTDSVFDWIAARRLGMHRLL